MSVTIGVLALQGDVDAHIAILEGCGAVVVAVRQPQDLDSLDGLIIPGGESTVMSRLCERYGLWEPLKSRLDAGLPAFGTCAGLIFLAKEIEGGAVTFYQKTLGVLDATVSRNAYGGQLDSFETDLEVPLLGAAIRGVFIRAPRITRVGDLVEVLAEHNGEAVLVRQGTLMAAAFHPEIAGEARVHEMWLASIRDSAP